MKLVIFYVIYYVIVIVFMKMAVPLCYGFRVYITKKINYLRIFGSIPKQFKPSIWSVIIFFASMLLFFMFSLLPILPIIFIVLKSDYAEVPTISDCLRFLSLIPILGLFFILGFFRDQRQFRIGLSDQSISFNWPSKDFDIEIPFSDIKSVEKDKKKYQICLNSGKTVDIAITDLIAFKGCNIIIDVFEKFMN